MPRILGVAPGGIPYRVLNRQDNWWRLFHRANKGAFDSHPSPKTPDPLEFPCQRASADLQPDAPEQGISGEQPYEQLHFYSCGAIQMKADTNSDGFDAGPPGSIIDYRGKLFLPRRWPLWPMLVLFLVGAIFQFNEFGDIMHGGPYMLWCALLWDVFFIIRWILAIKRKEENNDWIVYVLLHASFPFWFSGIASWFGA